MLPPDMLFVPNWLDNIQPLNPVIREAGDPVYPASRMTTKVISSSQRPTAGGTIIPREERRRQQLATQAKREGARRARKERKQAKQAENSQRARMDRMDRRAERRAAKEERRIMMERRQAAIAAFACGSPVWCDCHHCSYKEDIDG